MLHPNEEFVVLLVNIVWLDIVDIVPVFEETADKVVPDLDEITEIGETVLQSDYNYFFLPFNLKIDEVFAYVPLEYTSRDLFG